MKTLPLGLLIGVAGFLLQPSTAAMSSRPKSPAITLEGRLNSPYISHRGASVYLHLKIMTPDFPLPVRRPMNLSVVLDRSGSMADRGKIEYAKSALYSLIDQLSSKDIFSLVIYDDVIEVLCEPKPVRNKNELKRLIDRVFPRGATNLGEGLGEGISLVEQNLGREYVNRVILLSDGLANRGITEPHQLNRIARRSRSKSISLTTIGVGLEYNENLMVGLAENGGGNYYFIESPHGLASIFQREFNLLSSVVAQNASIEVTLGRGVFLRDIIGCEYEGVNARHLIPVGDLYSNDRREFTLELQIPAGTGSLVVAEGSLQFESKDGKLNRGHSFTVKAYYTRDVAVIEKNRDWDTQAKADVAVSTRNVERAMEALDEGRKDEAAEVLDKARELLRSSPAAEKAGAVGAAIHEQEQKLNSYSKVLEDDTSGGRKAKKIIQYDNYRTQKNK